MGLTSKHIDIGQLLCYRDDNYCEVVRPTYSLFHITAFFIVFFFVFVIGFLAGGSLSDVPGGLSFLFSTLFYIMIFCYFLLFFSKDFSAHIKQAYYQPIVFHRKQQKIYIYYNDSKNKIRKVEVLDWADIRPFIDVDYNIATTNYKGRHERCFFTASVCVKDGQGKKIPLFNHFYSTSFFSNIVQEKQALLDRVGDELAGYWNWCEAYMNDQEQLHPTTKINKHLFRAHWPESIHQQL